MVYTLFKRVTGAALLTVSLFSPAVMASDKLEISGFGRIVAGYLDDPNVEFEAYTNQVSFTEQSLLALQADYHLLDNLTVTAQLLAHSSNERDSGLEWLYVSYAPSPLWQVKAGRMRTPFYQYSDVIDVGFAYPWISPPQQLYSAFLFNQYDGVSLIRRFSFGDFSASVEGYYGVFDGDTTFQERSYPTDINNLAGIVFNGMFNSNLRVRASYIMADFSLDLEEITQFSDLLRSFGFNQSADSLTMQGEFDIYQLGVAYDSLDYNLASEWMEIQSNTVLAPNIVSYYLSGGMVFQPVTVSLTFADMIVDPSTAASDIPFGLSPDLDQLYYGYQTIFAQTQASDLQSLTFGVRWDASYNIAFKAEVTHFKGALGISTFQPREGRGDFDESANLYQLAMEFVF
ncbi:porin [Alteromonas lipolytica]|uniref:Porin domain-containing protein n=1 Tax=Alteromonas lipolytica TaxID=1856405 RepID=A0A1E8F9Y6_9ALTE|nr:porin [Alteromonas lipolytica]OFI32730.1 hypothetical protein BFC17_06145 [Alteromonas lipolytica]GGF73656.1 hypothetical protein GCM10011338_27160 [Alteromonas lipolytica]